MFESSIRSQNMVKCHIKGVNRIKISIAHYKQPDKRLQATQDKLFTALKRQFEQEKNFSDIKITILCQDAQVARQTYYRHYESIGDIIVVRSARMINQFLQKVDQTVNSTRMSETLTVTTLNSHRVLLAMIFWAKVDEEVIEYIVNDLARINSFQTEKVANEPFIAEMMARGILNFARMMLKYPQISQVDLIQLYKKTVPSPKKVFTEIDSY